MRILSVSAFVLTALISVFLVLYQFPHIPQHVSFDEVEFTKLALALKDQPYTPYSNLATGHPTLYFYTLLSSFEYFGLTIMALRLPAALFGILSGLAMIGLSIELCIHHLNMRRRSLFCAWLMSTLFVTLRWNFNFSRFAFEASLLVFLEVVSLWMILRFRRLRSYQSLVLSGLAAGLAYNSYTPGRLFFILPLMLIQLEYYRAYSLSLPKLNLITKILKSLIHKNLLIFLVPFLITIAPLTYYFATHTDIRFNQLSYVTNEHLSYAKRLEFAGQNVKSMVLMFFTNGDMNGRHNYPGKPALNPVIGLAMLAGLLTAWKRKAKTIQLLFYLYFFLALLPAFLTYPWENPNMLRTVTVLPSVAYFAMMGFSLVLKIRRSRYVAEMIVICLLCISIGYDARTYFVYQVPVFPHAFEYPLDQFVGRVRNEFDK